MAISKSSCLFNSQKEMTTTATIVGSSASTVARPGADLHTTVVFRPFSLASLRPRERLAPGKTQGLRSQEGWGLNTNEQQSCISVFSSAKSEEE